MEKQPRTLMEAVRYFADADRTLDMAVSLRWPDGIHCPTCGRTDVRFLATRRIWECKEKHAKKQFSAKVGTIFEDSALPLDKWFVAIWAVANCKNGISSYELARAVGVTQKSAWFMLHRIRTAMAAGGVEKFGGIVEADETYVGGASHKIAVKDANAKNLQGHIRATVKSGAALMTDSAWAYRGLRADYVHRYVNHAVEYVNGHIHTNGIENFWSLLKRAVRGTYVSVDPIHLNRYVAEQTFRFNERKDDDFGRFCAVLSSVNGKRLTYKELTSHVIVAF